MNNHIQISNKPNQVTSKFKHLILLLVLSLSFFPQAKATKTNWCTSLYTGLAVYITSHNTLSKEKSTNSTHQQDSRQLILHNSSAKQLDKLTSIKEQPPIQHRTLQAKQTIKQVSIENKKGLKLVNLYLHNHALSNKLIRQNTEPLYSLLNYTPQASYIHYAPKSNKIKTCNLYSPSITPYKLLTTTLIALGTSYLPTAQAAQLQEQAHHDQNAILCAGCIAVCCGMIPAPNPMCIVYCALVPCINSCRDLVD